MWLLAEHFAELLYETSLVISKLGAVAWAECSTFEMFCRKRRRGGCLLRAGRPVTGPTPGLIYSTRQQQGRMCRRSEGFTCYPPIHTPLGLLRASFPDDSSSRMQQADLKCSANGAMPVIMVVVAHLATL